MNRVAAVLPARAEEAVASLSLSGSHAEARALTRSGSRAPLWQHFQPGQLLELSGRVPGKLSTVARLVARAQAEGEPVAWVAARDATSFYPPDFARAGVALAQLIVVRVPPEQGAHVLVRASEVLLRSGAFGLVVIDFGAAPLLDPHAEPRASTPRGELAWQSRLAGLARMHLARVALLTSSPREQPSLGPLIGLRIEPHLRCEGARVVLAAEVLKSKLGAETALSPDVRSLPAGACL